MSMDDDGKIWLVNAGGERGPANFQIPIQYGAFMVNDQWEQDYEIPWPAPGIGDMQGGLPRVRMPANNLNHFTSTTGPEIVRSDRYPADMNGDLLFADPVGRFIRRVEDREDRRSDPGAERVSRIGVHHQHRPAVPPRQHQAGSGRRDLHPRHVPRHHPGRELDRPAARTCATRSSSTGWTRSINHGRIWRLRYDGVPAATAEVGGGPAGDSRRSSSVAPGRA